MALREGLHRPRVPAPLLDRHRPAPARGLGEQRVERVERVEGDTAYGRREVVRAGRAGANARDAVHGSARLGDVQGRGVVDADRPAPPLLRSRRDHGHTRLGEGVQTNDRRRVIRLGASHRPPFRHR